MTNKKYLNQETLIAITNLLGATNHTVAEIKKVLGESENDNLRVYSVISDELSRLENLISDIRIGLASKIYAPQPQ